MANDSQDQQPNTNAQDGAGGLEPGTDTGPTQPQDPNPSPFTQGFNFGDGAEHYDNLQPGETLAAFSNRHRIPINAVREANPDEVDANGNLLANVTRLVVP